MEDDDKRLESEEEEDESVKGFLDDLDKLTGSDKEKAQDEPLEDFLESQFKKLPHEKATELRAKRHLLMPKLVSRGWKTREAIALGERQAIDTFFQEDFEGFEKQFKSRIGREPASVEDIVAFLSEDAQDELAGLIAQPKYVSQVQRQWSKILVRRSLQEGAGFEDAFGSFLPGVQPKDLKTPEAFEKNFTSAFPDVRLDAAQKARLKEAYNEQTERLRKDQEKRWENTARILGAKKTFARTLKESFDRDEIWEREVYLQKVEAQAESINEAFDQINEHKAFLRKNVPQLNDYDLNQSLESIETALDFKELDPNLALASVLSIQSKTESLYSRTQDKQSTLQQSAFEAKYQIKELVFPGKMLHESKVSKPEFQDLLQKRLVFSPEVLEAVDQDFAARSNELFGIYEQKHEAQKGFDRQVDVFHQRCDNLEPLGSTYFGEFKEALGTRLRPLRDKTPILADFENALPSLEQGMAQVDKAWFEVDVTPELSNKKGQIFENMKLALAKGQRDLGSFFTKLIKLAQGTLEEDEEKIEDNPGSEETELEESLEAQEELEPLEPKPDNTKEEVFEVVQEAEEEAVKKEVQTDIDALLEEEEEALESEPDFGLSPQQWERLDKEGVQRRHIQSLYNRGIATDKWQWEKLLRLSYSGDKDLAKGFERLETLLQDPDNKPLETLLKRADLEGYEGVVLSSLCCLSADQFRQFKAQDMDEFKWEGSPRAQARSFVQFLWERNGIDDEFQTFAGNEYKSVIDSFSLDEVVEVEQEVESEVEDILEEAEETDESEEEPEREEETPEEEQEINDEEVDEDEDSTEEDEALEQEELELEETETEEPDEEPETEEDTPEDEEDMEEEIEDESETEETPEAAEELEETEEEPELEETDTEESDEELETDEDNSEEDEEAMDESLEETDESDLDPEIDEELETEEEVPEDEEDLEEIDEPVEGEPESDEEPEELELEDTETEEVDEDLDTEEDTPEDEEDREEDESEEEPELEEPETEEADEAIDTEEETAEDGEDMVEEIEEEEPELEESETEEADEAIDTEEETAEDEEDMAEEIEEEEPELEEPETEEADEAIDTEEDTPEDEEDMAEEIEEEEPELEETDTEEPDEELEMDENNSENEEAMDESLEETDESDLDPEIEEEPETEEETPEDEEDMAEEIEEEEPELEESETEEADEAIDTEEETPEDEEDMVEEIEEEEPELEEPETEEIIEQEDLEELDLETDEASEEVKAEDEGLEEDIDDEVLEELELTLDPEDEPQELELVEKQEDNGVENAQIEAENDENVDNLLKTVEEEETEKGLEDEKSQARQRQTSSAQEESKTEEEKVVEDEGKNVSDWLLNFRDQMRAQKVLDGEYGRDLGLQEQVAEERIEVSINKLDYSTLLVKLKSMALLSEKDYELWFKLISEIFVAVGDVSLGDIVSRFERYVSVLEPQAKVSIAIDQAKRLSRLNNSENVLAGLIWEWHQSRDARLISLSSVANQLMVRMNNRLVKIGLDIKAD